MFYKKVLSATLGVCRVFITTVSTWPKVSEYIPVPQNCSEIGVKSLLFSAWKLGQRGWIWEPLTIRQRGAGGGIHSSESGAGK